MTLDKKLIKTASTILIPLAIALAGMLGNSRYLTWRMDNVEKKVGALDAKIDNVDRAADKTNELLIQFLMNRGYSANRYLSRLDDGDKAKEVDVYFGAKAKEMFDEKTKGYALANVQIVRGRQQVKAETEEKDAKK